MSTFPDFYLHYNVKDRKILKVDREAEASEDLVITIKLEEALAKKLLQGIISETNLLVNHYANPPYVIDKSFFPENQAFYLLYKSDSLEVVQLVTQVDRVQVKAMNLSAVEVDELVAYSVLTGETSFADWEIRTTHTGEPFAHLSDAKSATKSSSLFNNRTDFLSLVELDLFESKEKEKTGLQKVCTILINHFENSVTIISEQHKSDDLFQDFIIAITKKNDPSYLIKKLNVRNGKTIKLAFDSINIRDLSFFSSKFHIRNSDIQVQNVVSGQLTIRTKGSKVLITNDSVFDKTLTECKVFLRNKYDKSQVYSVVKLTKSGKVTVKAANLDLTHVDFDVPSISKNHIKIIRDTANGTASDVRV